MIREGKEPASGLTASQADLEGAYMKIHPWLHRTTRGTTN